MFKLVIQDDEGKTTVVPLIRDEITIGRKEGNTIRLTERNVSRRHARILRNNGEVQIEDLGSYNGIRVNNARIAERVSLRVSDQVQIGDYKLYLKAEGVEQVDDARTMPIERVDNTATDVIAAVPATAAPTTPMAVPAAAQAGGLAPNAQVVGNPNRTLVAIADTDPQGRPVATAAAVAALTAPVGYGKLVVLSSNFAGKEFELSRPQMIIGRTDENDIVVNHRSISRNHAKLVREPDTGRYTISDLQSSNGVRVNGQDYGKVELRRGDVVDLGHVRLRFVEPGEDFVFARDAVITDVPDVGGKKNMLVAILLGIVVLGVGIGAFVMTRGDDNKGNGANGIVETPEDAGEIVAIAEDSGEAAIDPPIDVDAGSAAAPVNRTKQAEQIRLECKQAMAAKEWNDVLNCTDRLKPYEDDTAKEMREQAVLELKAQPRVRDLAEALRDEDFRKASSQLDQIPKSSVYRKQAEEDLKAKEESVINRLVAKANEAKGDDEKCSAYNKFIGSIRQGQGQRIHDAVRRKTRCAPKVATNPNPNPTPRCDPGDLKAKGQDAFQAGNYAMAYGHYEDAYACRKDAHSAQMAFLIACNQRSVAKAKKWWRMMPPNMQNQAQVTCIRNGISRDQLDR